MVAITPTTPAESSLQPAVVRDIGRADLSWALREGWSDFLEKRGDIVLLIVLYPVLMLLVAAATLGEGLFPLLLPLIAGLSLLGPVVAVGFYELARRREEGREATWAHFLDPFRGPSGAQIASLGIFLCLLFLTWIGVAWAIYQATLGTLEPADLNIFVSQLFTTPEGWALILFGNLAGFAFAAVTLVTTLVSFPLLVDRPVDLAFAVRTSLRAARRNPVEVATWGLVVAILLALACIPLFIGQYYFEMAPNPDSRITLADTVDPVFGQPQTHITWALSDRDEATYTQSTRLFQTAVASAGGEVYCLAWEDVKNQLIVNGHHIGTTRMSSDPTQGVVDANLKVHSLDNLYVAGSSVFASTGISNPTFTIITLSVRLARHLIGVLGK